MELFIENLQNNINVDNNNLNFITNHNKNQIELTDEESVHVKKGSGNYNCQYNCYFVIEFDNTTAWVWSKDIDLTSRSPNAKQHTWMSSPANLPRSQQVPIPTQEV